MIKIAERLHPFSHEMGEFFLLPRTCFSVQVFPTRIYLVDLEKQDSSFWVAFDWTGPVQEFTAQLDLERGGLSVFGKAKEGYVRYEIVLEDQSLWLKLDKLPLQGMGVSSSLFTGGNRKKGEKILLVESLKTSEGTFNEERLSLGNHKAQDFSSVRGRQDPRELFPHWLKLAQELPLTCSPQKREGNYALLDTCLDLVKNNQKQEVLSSLIAFYLSSFSGVFVPRLIDTQYQGIMSQEVSSSFLPLIPLLKESAECIRSLFYKEIEPGSIAILPCLPPQLHCGRMIKIQTTTGQTVDFEWTKKSLRKVFIHSSSSMQLRIWLPKGISSCRLKSKRDNLRKIEVPRDGVIELSLESGGQIALDRFEG